MSNNDDDQTVVEEEIEVTAEMLSHMKQLLRSKLDAQVSGCSIHEYDEKVDDINEMDDLAALGGKVLINEIFVSAIRAKMEEEDVVVEPVEVNDSDEESSSS